MTQDNITLKPGKFCKGNSCSDPECASVLTLAEEILQTIAETYQPMITSKRDGQLLEGLCNVLIEVDPANAREIWDTVYSHNEGLRARIDQIDHIHRPLQEIEEILAKILQS